MYKNQLLSRYFAQWVDMYKLGAVSEVTLKKYRMTLRQLEYIAPEVKLIDLNRLSYQEILNDYAKTHERQTVLDFHHQLKAAIQDAVDEGIIRRDPTRKAVIKGNIVRKKKTKFLSQAELHALLKELSLDEEHPYDYLLLLIAKTGLRFAEALGLTASDFDYQKQQVHINKTWNYKSPSGGFAPTKNESSQRVVRMDWQLCMQMHQFCKNKNANDLVFVQKGKRIFNATVNDRLTRLCEECDIPLITVHGLRHTHASLLLYAGVSVASVAKRLGHANMTTTQMTYLHIIRELEAKDNDKILQFLSTF